MLYTDDQKRDNLRKLADYLLSLPENYVGFDMADFFDTVALKKQITMSTSPDFDAEVRKQMKEVTEKYARENGGVARCGAVACAVGHGPTIGLYAVDKDFGELSGTMDWFAYTKRTFINPSQPGFYWMFGGQWSQHDNTPQGAGRRIRYYLANGVPEGFDEDEIDETIVAIYADA